MKMCIKCGAEKDVSDFKYNGMTTDQLDFECKQCRSGEVIAELPVTADTGTFQAVAVEAPVVEGVVAASEVTPIESPHDVAK